VFGPNKHLSTSVSISGSHRDPEFRAIYRETRERFTNNFGLEDFEIAFLPGGGTLGIESVISSSRAPIKIVGIEGTFTKRWSQMAMLYSKNKDPLEPKSLYCQVETSVSTYQKIQAPFVDAVCSFPFFDIPVNTEVFVTASNKLLGGLAGLAIVGVRKGRSQDLFRSSETSYLSLARYLEFAAGHQTPSTIGTYLFEVLLDRLNSYDLSDQRSQIQEICDELVPVLGSENLIGDHTGPVLTVRSNAVPEQIAKKWGLYAKSEPVSCYQIFTYSCPRESYAEFCRDLRRSSW
jgi:aspartate aminotransferase-like enzyme